ncbi:protein kinase domain-containing protein [Allorhodopirellula heiligendammensis]|uniref:non-specific serine/threonine protein kinase n=1 Tax=Allorhodopirellula heiligendammensis TaxID=2714739 RepID=A0A5C6C754_9BACT|nr:serine/threonine-protein kinase [Allorhodopirellula heiligendammensis]TWU19925.1 Serine/threonine-protein kinase PknB [Allorhodopirellula heiligendammensis]
MYDDQRITQLLERILATGCDPADACKACPELLPAVRQRLDDVQSIEQQLNEMFPDSDNATDQSRQESEVAKGQLPHFADYDVLEILGSGGMGVVFSARHRKLNRTVAIKMLRSGPFASHAEKLRFAREFHAIAALQHPHIVQIYDVGETEGRSFFSMELLEGGSLAERLAGTPQPDRQAAEKIFVLAGAVEFAHSNGVVHRDLKPANVLLSADGILKVVDFGLARHMDRDPAITVSGMRLGTPSYMAPEQARGDCKVVGTSVDVYALGAILYEMLTGRAPFRAETVAETQRQVIELEVLAPSHINASVPRDLETICLKCLRKLPEQRYASASELADDLKRFLNREPIHARPVGRVERLASWIRRNPALAGFLFTSVALIGFASEFTLQHYKAESQRRIEREKWTQRLAFVLSLEEEGRFTEARAILGRMPDGGSGVLREQIVKAQTELDLAEKLDAIRLSRGKYVPGGIDYQESSDAYRAAFQEARIGAVGLDEPDVVASRIKLSTVHVALIAALDDWAACAPAESRAWILEVARQADPNSWRDEVRHQEMWANVDRLQELADVAEIDEQPVTLLVAMGTRWRRLGGDPTEFLERVHHHYPQDFWLNFELGHLLSQHKSQLAIGHNLAALALRPNASAVHYNLAVNFESLNQLDEAIYYYQRVLESEPWHGRAEHQLAWTLLKSGHADDSIAHFRCAIELQHSESSTNQGLRTALLSLGRLEEARVVWERVFNEIHSVHEDVDGYAELCLFLGQEDRYIDACELLLERFGDTTNPLICERVGRACLLKPRSMEVRLAAERLIDRALSLKLSPDQDWARPYLLFAKALSEYRHERPREAITILQNEAGGVLPPAPNLVRAMALHAIGESNASRRELETAELAMDEVQSVNREAWMCKLLHREAVALTSRGSVSPDNRASQVPTDSP